MNSSKQFIFFVSIILTCFNTNADEVTLSYQGLTLNANYKGVEGSQTGPNNLVEKIILITHGGLAHKEAETIVYLQELLKERGYTTLAINLSLGLDNRHNMYNCDTTHRHQNVDAINEIDVWVNWLKASGIKQVILLGHSRGGAQTALYATERDNSLIKSYVLMAPATRDNADAGYQERYKKPLTPLLKKAQSLVNAGNGDTVIEHANLMFCRDTSVTANSFVSYYGPDMNLDTPYLIPKIKKPTLVIVAGNDEIVVNLDKKLNSLPHLEHLQMEVIDSSGHFFRDLNADDAVEIIDSFLNKVGFKN